MLWVALLRHHFSIPIKTLSRGYGSFIIPSSSSINLRISPLTIEYDYPQLSLLIIRALDPIRKGCIGVSPFVRSQKCRSCHTQYPNSFFQIPDVPELMKKIIYLYRPEEMLFWCCSMKPKGLRSPSHESHVDSIQTFGDGFALLVLTFETILCSWNMWECGHWVWVWVWVYALSHHWL